MKNKKIALLISIIGCTYLFYEQSLGINTLLFDLLLVGLLSIDQEQRLKFKQQWAIVGSLLLNAFAIALQNSTLAIMTHAITILLLAGLCFSSTPSLYIHLFNGVINLLFSFLNNVWLVMDTSRNQETPHNGKGSWGKKLSLYFYPIVITLIFLGLYSLANPVFSSFIQIPSVSISTSFVIFVLGATFFLTAFYYPFGNQDSLRVDANCPDKLSRVKVKIKQVLDTLALKTELQRGVLLFIMLNILLFFFNGVDLFYWINKKSLPEGVTFSAYLHQGVETLVVSILLAIGIILYYFRGNLNFYARNQQLIRFTNLWIAQNILLILNIVHKNQLYIHEFGLTYKRIGVYFYLLFSFIGLVITYLKVKNTQTVWYLLRRNSFYGLMILSISSLINWDGLIVHYNIQYAKQLDVTYLLNLNDSVLPELNNLLKSPKTNLSEMVTDYTRESDGDNDYPRYKRISQRQFIEKQVKRFKENYPKKEWQSWNYSDYQTYKQLVSSNVEF